MILWTLVSWVAPSVRLYDGTWDWAWTSHGALLRNLLVYVAGYAVFQRFAIRYQRKYVDPGKTAPRWLTVVNVVYTFIPVLLVPLVFQDLGAFMSGVSGVPEIATHPSWDPAVNYDRAATYFDLALKEIDIAIFGVYPPLWSRQYHAPWLTGVLEWCYFTYYVSPLVVVLPQILRRNWVLARRIIAIYAGSIFVSYIGYIVIPATGPRFEGGFINAWLPVEDGWFGARPMAVFLDNVEHIRWDAFPSGHTSVALVTVVLALRYHPKVGLVYLPCVLGLILSTVYMGYHFATDVLAGACFAGFAFLAVEPAIKWWHGDQDAAKAP